MKRRSMIKACIVGGLSGLALSLTGPLPFGSSGADDAFEPYGPSFKLRCWDGEKTLRFCKPKQQLGWVADAQYGGYYDDRTFSAQMVCDAFGTCGWINVNDPVQVQMYLTTLQSQYNWMNQQRLASYQAMISGYSGYDVSQPHAMPYIESVYSMVKQNSSVFIAGQNASGSGVVTQSRTLVKGVANVYDKVREWFGENEGEHVAGPQSNEAVATVTLPEGNYSGKATYTKAGALGVTDATVKDTRSGETGHIAKIVHDGQTDFMMV